MAKAFGLSYGIRAGDVCIPGSNLAEWHLTYRCNLACTGCNRACFLPPHTRDMTLADAEEFVRQARALGWLPDVALLGGEPTLHSQFIEFIPIARQLSGRVIVVSNGFSEHARKQLEEAKSSGAEINYTSHKSRGSIVHSVLDIFQAPVDFGIESRSPCTWHSSAGWCGICVDAEGYVACPIGGTIDSILKLGARTRQLADLWSPEKAAALTATLCRYCGKGLGLDKKYPAACRKYSGINISATWQRAFERLTKES